ncbi:MAG: Capsular polysaccharide synthesis enzyme Cap8C; Manganese-dependent protein-tyrosine phosphatase (EC [uncultured Sulfurovum sp.]|uniref:protein-tyrosine-phosphatase n=1 Tax=uncultured Sulfurovum sp. TaxID=269237 RepID=A0A6S6U1U1_9BACT|nr:MAG: Capsular polysaccharide synthesis enzyme Cap8C; Manganese-dependent protein-tyrosine phosphatase (EC [uncultured Sulfurovum sp.]
MFSFFKKKIQIAQEPIVVPPLLVDVHSHLIPGIDDGSQTMEESLVLLKALEAVGYKKIITTPHIMVDAYGNTKESILQGLQVLQNEAKKHNIHVEIEAASEYYLDEGLLSLIHKKEILLIEDKYLLFETSYIHRPTQLEEVIFEILAAGYIPLLAHPERYRYIADPEEFQRLKTLGVLFQVNLNSFHGHYGAHAKKHANFLSQHGLIDFLGSDTHNIKQVEYLSEVLTSHIYSEIYRYNTIKNPSLI